MRVSLPASGGNACARSRGAISRTIAVGIAEVMQLGSAGTGAR